MFLDYNIMRRHLLYLLLFINVRKVLSGIRCTIGGNPLCTIGILSILIFFVTVYNLERIKRKCIIHDNLALFVNIIK